MIDFVLALLALHWLADFVFQVSWMARNKRCSILALSLHVLTYMAVLGTGLSLVTTLPWTAVVAFVSLNGLVHYVQDAITSRINHLAKESGFIHLYFTLIGLDQLIHQAVLLYSARWLLM